MDAHLQLLAGLGLVEAKIGAVIIPPRKAQNVTLPLAGRYGDLEWQKKVTGRILPESPDQVRRPYEVAPRPLVEPGNPVTGVLVDQFAGYAVGKELGQREKQLVGLARVLGKASVPLPYIVLHPLLLREVKGKAGPFLPDEPEGVEMVPARRFRQSEPVGVGFVVRPGEAIYQAIKRQCRLSCRKLPETGHLHDKFRRVRLCLDLRAAAPCVIVLALGAVRQLALDVMHALNAHEHPPCPSRLDIHPDSGSRRGPMGRQWKTPPHPRYSR